MSQPIITIIIPVYNAVRYIDRCIESVLAQTFTGWELLLVDDGSTDGSDKICDRYAAADPRIKTIHKTNGGAASARNAGLDHANGINVCFIDADDYVTPLLLADYLAAETADMVICGLKMTRRGHAVDLVPAPCHCGIDDFRLNISCLNMILIGSTVNKLYRRDIIERHHLRMDSGLADVGEDHVFNWNYLQHTGSVTAISSENYVYEENPASLTRSITNHAAMDHAEKCLTLMKRLYDLFSRIPDKRQRGECQRLYQSYFFYNIIRPLYLNSSDSSNRRRILSRYRSLQKSLACNPVTVFPGPVNRLIMISAGMPERIADTCIQILLAPKRAFHNIKNRIKSK